MVLELCPKTSPEVGEGAQLRGILLQGAQHTQDLGQIGLVRKAEM